MTEIKFPSTHELLRDLNAAVFFQLSNLYRLLMSESYQSFSMNKKDFDKLPQKEKQKCLKELSKKTRPFCKNVDAALKGKFRSSLGFPKNIFIRPTRYYKIEDFNAIVDFIVQENLLAPTIDPLPKIDMSQVASFAKQALEEGPSTKR